MVQENNQKNCYYNCHLIPVIVYYQTPLKDMTLRWNAIWQDLEKVPAKLRQIECGFVDRFIELLITLCLYKIEAQNSVGWQLYFANTNRTVHGDIILFYGLLREVFPNIAKGCSIEMP